MPWCFCWDRRCASHFCIIWKGLIEPLLPRLLAEILPQRGWWPIASAVVFAGVQRFVSCSWVQWPLRSFGWGQWFDWIRFGSSRVPAHLGACQVWRLGWAVQRLYSLLRDCCLDRGWGCWISRFGCLCQWVGIMAKLLFRKRLDWCPLRSFC